MLLRSPSDALHRTEVLKFSAETATKLLKLKPMKTPVAHELKPFNPSNRVIISCQECEQNNEDNLQDLL
jgi:ribulose-5-phosphate 4-epimerase/fuculose-1-phosphate aldolase